MARIRLPEGDGPEIVRAFGLRPKMAEGVYALEGAIGASELPHRLHELIRLRIAQINNCPI